MPGPVDALLRMAWPVVAPHRFALYTFLSLAAVLATTVNALRNHSNFYSVTVYLSRSSRSLMVLANFGFLTALLCGKIMQKIFLGPLLPAEVERLYDRTWFFITESLLAFTIFRDEFDVTFSLMFGFLLFVKCFHWLMADRIEWMDQRPYPGPPTLFHVRILSLFTLLSFTDIAMFMFAYQSIMANDIDATILFANEYAILAVSAWNAFAKYGLTVYELRRAATRGGADAPPWEAKSSWIFWIELITDGVKLFTYSIFFAVITAHFGLPLNLIRDLYMTTASFFSRVTAFQRYRSATRDMDQRYPNASEAELSATDGTCIICREEMTLSAAGEVPAQTADGPNMTPKKLPCGHIFHFHCLRSWLERQQNCPTCRRTVMDVNTPAHGAPGQRAPVQQAPANGGLPPPPQRPGGQPRPWGLFAQDQAAAQQPNQAQVGVMGGFVRRLLGAAAEPPLVPGQFGNGPLAQQPGVAAPPLPGAGPAQNGVQPPEAGGQGGQRPPALVFEYNYVHEHGQPPRLMAPPMLQGFYREDGLWQGWPAQGRVEGRPAATRTATGPTPNAETLASPTTPSALPVVQAGPSGTAPSTAANDLSTSSTTQDPPTASVPARQALRTDSAPATPRDAAAQAALRRFGATLSSAPPISPSPTSSNVVSPSGIPASNTNTSTNSTPAATPAASTVPAPTAMSRTAPTATRPASSQSNSASTQSRAALPSVIPLYDFGRRHTVRQTPTPVARAANHHEALFQQRSPGVHRMPGQLGARPQPQPQHRPSFARAPSSVRTTGSLPAQLTEEELRRMDRLTRDAIDERIRVLEGVNGVVHRCLEELLRLRSVLPPVVTAPVPAEAGAAPASTAAGSSGLAGAASATPRENARDVKGKGKEVEPAAATHESSGSHPPAPPVGRGTSATVGSDVLAHSLPSATPIVPTGGEVTEASPLVAQTPESSAHPTAEIAASTGTLAEPGPLTSEGNAAGQVDATADAYSGLGSLPPPTSHEARAEPEALPSVDRTQLLAGGEQPGEEVRRGEHHSGREDGPPAALLREQTDRVSGEGGSGEEGGERWETVEREAHSSGSSERM